MEIGSEFSNLECINGDGICFPNDFIDECLVFSGRTAIETIILNEKKIKKVMVPSYCCESMLIPFIKEGIELYFYNVFFDNGLKINFKVIDDIDAILWCNYFGFNLQMPDLIEFINRGGIVIEDVTHSFFSSNQYNEQSHYLVASLRKWGPLLSGGYCASKYKKFLYKPMQKPASDYISMKSEAMKLKSEFLKGNNADKTGFLEKFTICNNWLAANYTGLVIDSFSKSYIAFIDQKKEREVRKKNASFLYSKLNDLNEIKFLFLEKDMDCPLFVPIIIENGKRDFIRKKLLDKDIYCPIHWPIPNEFCKSNIYDMELSLVCDQRYSEEDMHRIVSVIYNAFRKDN